ncbi:hypothetical protein, partial [Bradyrhizobium sp. JYMT SZCCT0428]|uniref:hypothetical protein n=1 Tax=Bradyrhizobium sp. JYMT SZCCT0428 TaxID=2807673 RepID=UPI001BA8F89B
ENTTGYLLAMPDESRIITLIDQLGAALKEAGLQRSSFGEKYSIYSFRHFYAVKPCATGSVYSKSPATWVRRSRSSKYYGKQAIAAVFATRLGD